MKDGTEKNVHALLDTLKLKESAELAMPTLSILEKTALATLVSTVTAEKSAINVIVHAVNALVLRKINAQCVQM